MRVEEEFSKKVIFSELRKKIEKIKESLEKRVYINYPSLNLKVRKSSDLEPLENPRHYSLFEVKTERFLGIFPYGKEKELLRVEEPHIAMRGEEFTTMRVYLFDPGLYAVTKNTLNTFPYAGKIQIIKDFSP